MDIFSAKKYRKMPVWASLTVDFRCDQIAGERARRVDRVLDVRQGELCWVAGTVYMDMPLKPNILEDLTKEVGNVQRPIDVVVLIPGLEFHVGTPSTPQLH